MVDAGIAAQVDEWSELQGALAQEALVVLYERAGYGASEPGPMPRDSGRVANELGALLDAASIPGPYILVGHSLGGLNVQVFANRHPDEVAGLVLLDPPPLAWILGEGFPELRSVADAMTTEWQSIADAGSVSSEPGDRAEAVFFETIASEHREMFGESARLAGAIESFGDIPLVVVASGVPNPMFGDVAERYQAYWADESRAIAEKSTRGEFVLAERSTHMLHRDAADLVLASIRSVVTQVIPEE